MNTAYEKLPSFSKPPLVEVALSVQFEPLTNLMAPQLGLFWSKVRDRFPNIKQVNPANSFIERLGVRKTKPIPKIELAESFPLPRLWFIDSSERELIQIQTDRFSRNWRKIDPSDKYPRYESHIREKFYEDLNELNNFLANEDIGELKPKQCELTYINHIVSGEGWSKHSELGCIFKGWNSEFIEKLGVEVEDINANMRILIRDKKDDFLGRLHINFEPAFRNKDNTPIFLLNITARGRPTRECIEGVFEFLDLGHRYVVSYFDAITTDEMHKIWRKEDV